MNLFEALTGLTSRDQDSIWYQVLAQGFKGLGYSQPNPSVGCVIVNSHGEVIAQGYHAQAGQAHAEIEALKQIAPITQNVNGEWQLESAHYECLKNAVVYISLEPCAHQGRTPSCALTLSQLPIQKVVYLLKDPNPLVAGKGKSILAAKGIVVECLEEQEAHSIFVKAARFLHAFFLQGTLHHRPFITLKLATSADGYMGLKDGSSHWITSEETRLLARHWRGLYDGVMTGVNTVLHDNPFLDARQTPYQLKKRQLIVWDSKAQLLKNSQLNIYKSYAPDQVTLLVDSLYKDIASWGPQVLPQPALVSAQAINNLCRQLDLTSLWIEAGPTLTSSMLQAQVPAEILLFQAPCFIGAINGVSLSKNISTLNLAQLKRWQSQQVQIIANSSDILWRWG